MVSMLRLRYVWTGVAGTPWYTNFYVEGLAASAAENAADEIDIFWKGLSFQFSNQLAVTLDPFVVSISPSSGEIVDGFSILPRPQVQGQESSSLLPRQSQALATWSTGVYLGGRQIKGRTFLGGFTEAANDFAGVILETYRANMEDALQTLVDSDANLVVWSKKNGIAAPITSVAVKAEWATMNSRRD